MPSVYSVCRVRDSVRSLIAVVTGSCEEPNFDARN